MSGFQQSDKPYTPDDTLTTKSPGKAFAKPPEQICHQKDQEPEIRMNTGFSGSFHWLGMRDSNSHIQSQSLSKMPVKCGFFGRLTTV